MYWFLLFVVLGFTYKNESYRNNSVILIHHDDIFHPIISCVTDNSSFYSQSRGFSDWYDPSGSRVLDLYDVYSRDNHIPLEELCFIQSNYSRPITLLNLIYTLGESFTESENNNCSGLYRCLITDCHGELQQLFLGIYSEICKL